MKKLLTAVLAVICAAVLIFGYLQWKEQTKVKVDHPEKVSSEFAEVDLEKEKEDRTEEDFLRYLSNWPEESVATFKEARTENRPFRILLAGSNSLGTSSSGWTAIVTEKLGETFGKDIIEAEVLTYDLTSDQFVQQEKSAELAAAKADMILFEPLTLNDNGEVAIGNSHQNIETIIADVKAESPNTVFILQPPHPLHNANYYPLQVQALKEFAEAQAIPYLDHWTAWPDPSTDAVIPLLAADQSQPSEEGHQLWAEYVLQYLLTK